MEKTKESEETVLNYKVNGKVISFKTKAEFMETINNFATYLREPLTVEPLDRQGLDYDHMQEILDLTYEVAPCLKGIQAIAECIQREGNFNSYEPMDIVWLGYRCKELLDGLIDTAEASTKVYEKEWARIKEKAERMVQLS